MFNQMRDCTYDKNILDSWMMANPLIGERVPPIEASVYEFMTEDDRETYDGLDDVVRVFRAMSISEADLIDMNERTLGQSWTLRPQVAIKFANMPKILSKEENVIIEGVVLKKSILGYVDVRLEEECIIKIDSKIVVENIHRGEKND